MSRCASCSRTVREDHCHEDTSALSSINNDDLIYEMEGSSAYELTRSQTGANEAAAIVVSDTSNGKDLSKLIKDHCRRLKILPCISDAVVYIQYQGDRLNDVKYRAMTGAN